MIYIMQSPDEDLFFTSMDDDDFVPNIDVGLALKQMGGCHLTLKRLTPAQIEQFAAHPPVRIDEDVIDLCAGDATPPTRSDDAGEYEYQCVASHTSGVKLRKKKKPSSRDGDEPREKSRPAVEKKITPKRSLQPRKSYYVPSPETVVDREETLQRVMMNLKDCNGNVVAGEATSPTPLSNKIAESPPGPPRKRGRPRKCASLPEKADEPSPKKKKFNNYDYVPLGHSASAKKAGPENVKKNESRRRNANKSARTSSSDDDDDDDNVPRGSKKIKLLDAKRSSDCNAESDPVEDIDRPEVRSNERIATRPQNEFGDSIEIDVEEPKIEELDVEEQLERVFGGNDLVSLGLVPAEEKVTTEPATVAGRLSTQNPSRPPSSYAFVRSPSFTMPDNNVLRISSEVSITALPPIAKADGRSVSPTGTSSRTTPSPPSVDRRTVTCSPIVEQPPPERPIKSEGRRSPSASTVVNKAVNSESKIGGSGKSVSPTVIVPRTTPSPPSVDRRTVTCSPIVEQPPPERPIKSEDRCSTNASTVVKSKSKIGDTGKSVSPGTSPRTLPSPPSADRRTATYSPFVEQPPPELPIKSEGRCSTDASGTLPNEVVKSESKIGGSDKSVPPTGISPRTTSSPPSVDGRTATCSPFVEQPPPEYPVKIEKSADLSTILNKVIKSESKSRGSGDPCTPASACPEQTSGSLASFAHVDNAAGQPTVKRETADAVAIRENAAAKPEPDPSSTNTQPSETVKRRVGLIKVKSSQDLGITDSKFPMPVAAPPSSLPQPVAKRLADDKPTTKHKTPGEPSSDSVAASNKSKNEDFQCLVDRLIDLYKKNYAIVVRKKGSKRAFCKEKVELFSEFRKSFIGWLDCIREREPRNYEFQSENFFYKIVHKLTNELDECVVKCRENDRLLNELMGDAIVEKLFPKASFHSVLCKIEKDNEVKRNAITADAGKRSNSAVPSSSTVAIHPPTDSQRNTQLARKRNPAPLNDAQSGGPRNTSQTAQTRNPRPPNNAVPPAAHCSGRGSTQIAHTKNPTLLHNAISPAAHCGSQRSMQTTQTRNPTPPNNSVPPSAHYSSQRSMPTVQARNPAPPNNSVPLSAHYNSQISMPTVQARNPTPLNQSVPLTVRNTDPRIAPGARPNYNYQAPSVQSYYATVMTQAASQPVAQYRQSTPQVNNLIQGRAATLQQHFVENPLAAHPVRDPRKIFNNVEPNSVFRESVISARPNLIEVPTVQTVADQVPVATAVNFANQPTQKVAKQTTPSYYHALHNSQTSRNEPTRLYSPVSVPVSPPPKEATVEADSKIGFERTVNFDDCIHELKKFYDIVNRISSF